MALYVRVCLSFLQLRKQYKEKCKVAEVKKTISLVVLGDCMVKVEHASHSQVLRAGTSCSRPRNIYSFWKDIYLTK